MLWNHRCKILKEQIKATVTYLSAVNLTLVHLVERLWMVKRKPIVDQLPN